MKVIALYRPETDHERTVTDYQRDFLQRTGHEIELVSLDTVEGSSMAKLYDVTNYPALLAVTDEGILKQMWQDDLLPLFDEVQAYFIV